MLAESFPIVSSKPRILDHKLSLDIFAQTATETPKEARICREWYALSPSRGPAEDLGLENKTCAKR